MADKFQLKAIISAVDKMTPALKNIQRSVKLTKKTLTDVSTAGGDLFAKIGLSTAALGGGVAFAVKKIVDTSAEFERYQTILETIEGSSEKARQSMAWVQDFAVKTPYELSQVTDAFVKLKAYGIEPQAGALSAAGNAAAAMGKDVMQAVEALADAMTGENERLKEFGIKASKQGDTIVYTWTENGKTMAARAKANSKEMIEATITGIWNRRYGGAMDKLSTTWSGMWSNLMDQITKFTKMIGDAGLFDALKGQLSGVLGMFDKWEKDGTLKKIATQISDELVITIKELTAWVKSVDWAGVIRGVRETVTAIAGFIESVGGAKTVLIALGVVMLAGPVASIITLIGAFARLAMVATPVVAVAAAVAAAGYLIYSNWDKLAPSFSGVISSVSALGSALMKLWQVLGPILMPVLKLVGAFLGGVLLLAIQGITDAVSAMVGVLTLGVEMLSRLASFVVPDWIKEVFSGGDISVAQGKASTPLVQSGALKVAGGRSQLNGEMTVRFENAPAGMRVAPGRTNQPGVSMNPDVGYRSLGVVG